MLINVTPKSAYSFISNTQRTPSVGDTSDHRDLLERVSNKRRRMLDLNYKYCITTFRLTLCIVIMTETSSLKRSTSSNIDTSS